MIVAAAVLLALAAACFFGRVVWGPSLADRIIALDGLVVTIVSAVLVTSAGRESDQYLDVAVVVAFVGFVGTVAGARYVERRGG